MVSHISFNDQTQHGRHLRRILNALEELVDGLPDVLSVMTQMIDGDGSLASHFTYATGKYGFASDDKSKAAWDELNSLQSKINTDSVVASVKSAFAQALAKFG